MGRGSARQLLFLAAALAFGIAGQYNFGRGPAFHADGVVLWTLALGLFLLLLRRPASPSQPRAEESAPGWSAVARAALASAGLALGAVVVGRLARPHEGDLGLFRLWLLAIALYLMAFAHRPRLPVEAAWRWLRRDGPAALLAAGILLLALGLRAWHVDSIPWTLGGDEGSQGLWARDVLSGRLREIFGTGWLSVPNMSFWWQALWLRLVGDDVLGLRLPWAFVGASTVLGAYLLVKRLFGAGLGLLTAFLLAVYHFPLHYSRLGSNQIADACFMVWALYLAVVGCAGRRRWAWALGGAVAGAAFYFYAGARQVPLVLAGGYLWAALTERGFLVERRAETLAWLGGFLIAAGPMLLYAAQHPDDFNARLNTVGVFQSGWLEREVVITGRSRADLLFEQLRRAFGAFVAYPDRAAWYNASIPLLDGVWAIPFLFGIAVAVSRLPRWGYAVLLGWFVTVVLLGGALTTNPPESQRLVSSAVPVAFFVALGLRTVVAHGGKLLGASRPARRLAVAGAAAVLAATSLGYYFGPYQASWVYGSANGEVATRLGYYLRDLGPGWRGYFFGAPRMHADFASIPFIAPNVPLTDVALPLTAPPAPLPPEANLVFIFLPERAGELRWVRDLRPDGVVEEVHRAGEPQGPLLFIAYRAPRR